MQPLQVSLVWQLVILAVVPVAALPEGATVTELVIASVTVVQIFIRHAQVLHAGSYVHTLY